MKKVELMIPNSLYGDKTVTAYQEGDLYAAKGKNFWLIYTKDGFAFPTALRSNSRKEAIVKIKALMELPIDWTLPGDSQELRNSLSEHKQDILDIGWLTAA